MKKKRNNIRSIKEKSYKYNYEFSTEIKTSTLAPGLNKQTILLVSKKKGTRIFITVEIDSV